MWVQTWMRSFIEPGTWSWRLRQLLSNYLYDFSLFISLSPPLSLSLFRSHLQCNRRKVAELFITTILCDFTWMQCTWIGHMYDAMLSICSLPCRFHEMSILCSLNLHHHFRIGLAIALKSTPLNEITNDNSPLENSNRHIAKHAICRPCIRCDKHFIVCASYQRYAAVYHQF